MAEVLLYFFHFHNMIEFTEKPMSKFFFLMSKFLILVFLKM